MIGVAKVFLDVVVLQVAFNAQSRHRAVEALDAQGDPVFSVGCGGDAQAGRDQDEHQQVGQELLHGFHSFVDYISTVILQTAECAGKISP